MKKDVEIWVHDNGKWQGYTAGEYLSLKINYKWNDIVTMSIEHDISIRRMIAKLIKSGGLMEINKIAIDQLTLCIRYQIANL